MNKNNSPNISADLRLFRTSADRPMALLSKCPIYTPTPLIDHGALANDLGVSRLFMKDESHRMRLGSFKALGGAFAVAQMISDAAMSADLTNEAAKTAAAGMTFITASAGNHGLSVAAGANIFGAKAVVYLSSLVPVGFGDRIRALGATVVRIDGVYEDSVAAAKAAAEDNGWLLLADGSWEGYIERPALVMEGYTVLAEECRTEFERLGVWPTHVLIQAGVGGLAAAVAGHIRDNWKVQPKITIVEPKAAPCLKVNVGTNGLTRVEGPISNMGRLDCKEASLIAAKSLKNDASEFILVSDEEASRAVDLLARHNIETTPSGAATVAALAGTNVSPESRCLVIVTEGLEGG
jgi:diaminopropionate ammonia-lyase